MTTRNRQSTINMQHFEQKGQNIQQAGFPDGHPL